jgi:hypothetical protein
LSPVCTGAEPGNDPDDENLAGTTPEIIAARGQRMLGEALFDPFFCAKAVFRAPAQAVLA